MQDAFGVSKGFKLPRFRRAKPPAAPASTPRVTPSNSLSFSMNGISRQQKASQGQAALARGMAGIPHPSAPIPSAAAPAAPKPATKPKKKNNKGSSGSAFKNPWVIGGAAVGGSSAIGLGTYAHQRRGNA